MSALKVVKLPLMEGGFKYIKVDEIISISEDSNQHLVLETRCGKEEFKCSLQVFEEKLNALGYSLPE